MTFQSSFLIRCRVTLSGDSSTKTYSIQHVQTGDEFRCASLAEALEWMTTQNSRYLASVLESSTASSDVEEEDAK